MKTMLGSMMILALAVTGQLPAADRPANPQAVVSKPGETRPKQWLEATSPIDGRPIKILGWLENGQVRFDPAEYPQFVPATKPPEPAKSATNNNPITPPTGVVFAKFPQVAAGHTWTGGNAPHPVGDTAGKGEKPRAPEVFVTIIGSRKERERVKTELARDPEFAVLSKLMGSRLAIEAYDPKNPLVADVGLPNGGSPDIVVLDAGGKEVERFDKDPGPESIAEAIRKADPSYKPGGKKLHSENDGVGGIWILAGLLAVGLIFWSRKAPTT